MKISHNIFACLVCCAVITLIFCTGCTQSASQEKVISGTAIATVIDPAQLALTRSDMPQEFTLVESRTKNPSDMTRLALDLGWQSGHVVRYTSPAQNSETGYEIVHSIAVYPARTIPDVIAYSDKQAHADQGYGYTDFTVTGLGDHARAFSGKAGAVLPASTPEENPLIISINSQEKGMDRKTNFSEIIFSKGNTFEVIKMTGPSPDTALLLNISQKAYAKIP